MALEQPNTMDMHADMYSVPGPTGDPNYIPALHVRDVPSRGKSSRIKGITTGRVHQLLSGIELNSFYIFDWSPVVRDIQEQFELPLDETASIARELHIKHPVNPKTKELNPITLDYRLTIHQEALTTTIRAVSVKPAEHLDLPRVQEKLEIENAYCRAHNIPWHLVTDLELNHKANAIFNIDWVHDAYYLDANPLVRQWLSTIEECLLLRLCQEDRPLNILALETDKRLGLPNGTSLTAVRHLIATRRWLIDMSVRAHPSLKLSVSRNPLCFGKR